MKPSDRVPVSDVRVSVFVVPTESPESDGTYAWETTALVLVEVLGGGQCGIGYTYADHATARLVQDELRSVVVGRDALAVEGAFVAMLRSVRNLGNAGVASMAISAIDIALWDLKAKLLRVPLMLLLGSGRESIGVYGSGGFTSYPVTKLCSQLVEWVSGQGMNRVMMKVGRDATADPARVEAAREALGVEPELFVDAGGAYDRKQAIAFAGLSTALGVTLFQEPVPESDLEGLRLVRDHAPMDVTAGEYGGSPTCYRHGAPSLHAHVACATSAVLHTEYAYDHVRVEQMLFDGAAHAKGGAIDPDRTRPGLGLELKRKDAERFAA